jgi:hypothetical protein
MDAAGYREPRSCGQIPESACCDPSRDRLMRTVLLAMGVLLAVLNRGREMSLLLDYCLDAVC